MSTEPTAQPHPIAVDNGSNYAALATASLEANARHLAQAQKAVQFADALKATLHPSIWGLVSDAIEADRSQCEAYHDALIAELTRHLPGLAPTITLLWEHVQNASTADIASCCAGVGDPRLAAVFERIARAAAGYTAPLGMTPYALLESYAELIEENANVGLFVGREPTRDPAVQEGTER